MATYAAQQVTVAGLAATYNAASASDLVPPGSIIHVKNGNASACTVSVVTAATVDGQAIGDPTVSVPATTGERFIFIPDTAPYRDPATGLVGVLFSVTATVTYAVIARQV